MVRRELGGEEVLEILSARQRLSVFGQVDSELRPASCSDQGGYLGKIQRPALSDPHRASTKSEQEHVIRVVT
jgi:hypothetical protein